MVDPALNAGVEIGKTDFSSTPGLVALAQAPGGCDDLARLDAAVVGENDKTQPWDTAAARQHLRRVLVNAQAQSPRQKALDLGAPGVQARLVVVEQREVVDIAQVGGAAKFGRCACPGDSCCESQCGFVGVVVPGTAAHSPPGTSGGPHSFWLLSEYRGRKKSEKRERATRAWGQKPKT
jgi:hypothetical protein